jgi:large subunit ribosomal protein L10
MNRDQKAAVVDEIAAQIQGADAVFAVDYRGISVSQVAELRGKLRDADAAFRIVKNSLTELAADKAGATELRGFLQGPTALALVNGDAALAAKALNDTARALQILEFKGGLMNGSTVTAEEIRSIARLPSRDVLHGQLVGMIASPLSGLVRTLNALIQGIAIQLQAIADQGLVTGEAPEPTPEAEAAPEEPTPEPEAEAAPEEPTSEPEAEAAPEEPTPEPEAEAAPEPAAETQSSEAETEPDASSDASEE